MAVFGIIFGVAAARRPSHFRDCLAQKSSWRPTARRSPPSLITMWQKSARALRVQAWSTRSSSHTTNRARGQLSKRIRERCAGASSSTFVRSTATSALRSCGKSTLRVCSPRSDGRPLSANGSGLFADFCGLRSQACAGMTRPRVLPESRCPRPKGIIAGPMSRSNSIARAGRSERSNVL